MAVQARARRWWTRIGPVALVFGLAAVLLLSLTIADAVALRTHLAVPEPNLSAPDLYRRIWWDLSRGQVLLMAISAVAAVAAHLMLRNRNQRTIGHRVALGGALVWLIGSVASSGWWWLSGSDGGWFNYAPNAGVLFSTGGGPDRELVGLVVACTGLAIALVAITWVTRSDDEGAAG